MTYQHSKAERIRQERLDREAKQRDADLEWLLAQPQGRRVLAVWLERTGVEGPTVMAEVPLDVPRVMWREGRRSVGLDLAAEARRVNPRLFATMRAESLIAAAEAQERERAAAIPAREDDE